MPGRRTRLLTSSRKLLTAPRLHVRARKMRYRSPDALPPIALRAGLNEPESRVAQALDELRIRYETQVPFLGGNALGGGRADFLLADYKVDLEYQGPWHGTTYGLGKDILRNAGVRAMGFRVEFLFERDLPRLKPRILEIIGVPL